MSAESNEPRSNLIGINREPTNLIMNDLKKFVQMSRLYNAVKAQRKRKKAEQQRIEEEQKKKSEEELEF